MLTREKIKRDGDTVKLDGEPGEEGQREKSFIYSKSYGQDTVLGARNSC